MCRTAIGLLAPHLSPCCLVIMEKSFCTTEGSSSFSTCEHECDLCFQNDSRLQGWDREKSKGKKGGDFLLEALLGGQFFSW